MVTPRLRLSLVACLIIAGGCAALPGPTGEPQPTGPARPATAALVAEARAQRAVGEYGMAAAAAERAIRIDGRDPWAWLELGEIRLAERAREQAANLARRALSLAGADATAAAAARNLLARAAQ